MTTHHLDPEDIKPSRRKTAILILLLAVVALATAGAMTASVILYMKSA